MSTKENDVETCSLCKTTSKNKMFKVFIKAQCTRHESMHYKDNVSFERGTATNTVTISFCVNCHRELMNIGAITFEFPRNLNFFGGKEGEIYNSNAKQPEA